MGVENQAALFHRQHAAVVGEGMDEDHGVLACLDDLVEVANGAAAHGAGQGAVDPHGFLAAEQIAPDQVAGAEVLVAGDGDERLVEVAARRRGVFAVAVEAVRHVLDEARFAAAGGAGEQHRQAGFVGGEEHLDFVGERDVVRGLVQLWFGVSECSSSCHWDSSAGLWGKQSRAGTTGWQETPAANPCPFTRVRACYMILASKEIRSPRLRASSVSSLRSPS